MSVEIVMPQMGESIAEGTISKWLKQVGETVEKDEPILEISTDKVDAEVPSPSAGVLLEIRAIEGETVEVNSVVGILGAAGESPLKSSNGNAAISTEVVKEIQTPEESIPVAVPQGVPAGVSEEVVMPQMGESITEGTVSKWLKSVGETIEKDEPLLEISTDKVDAEVPSPVGGVLLDIRVNEGETVEVGSVVGLVGAKGAAVTPKVATESVSANVPIAAKQIDLPTMKTNGTDQSVEDLRKTKSSPLVRNIAKEHGVDIARIPGSGISGRVTKNDILSFIESGAALRPEDLLQKGTPKSTPQPAKADYQAPQVAQAVGDRIEPMSLMRKKIAEHMTFSKQTSAHVTSVYEIDMTNVAKFRQQHKSEFQERFGTKLTYMPFIFQAVTNALRKFPVVNSQVSGDKIVYKGDVNIGMAVALDWGLIVPVIKKADLLSLSGLAQAANDLADRARTKKLMPDEVSGGTFTITNPGVFGGLFGTPIINQPQVAILCVGTIEKRPKVITTEHGDDAIVVRSMAYFALTYDHRIVDGAEAERFLSFMKDYIENTAFSL